MDKGAAMNPVFVFLVILGAALLWLLCSFAFRLIGGIATHFVKKAEKAMSDEPSKKDMFVAGFKSSLKEKEKDEG